MMAMCETGSHRENSRRPLAMDVWTSRLSSCRDNVRYRAPSQAGAAMKITAMPTSRSRHRADSARSADATSAPSAAISSIRSGPRTGSTSVNERQRSRRRTADIPEIQAVDDGWTCGEQPTETQPGEDEWRQEHGVEQEKPSGLRDGRAADARQRERNQVQQKREHPHADRKESAGRAPTSTLTRCCSRRARATGTTRRARARTSRN